MKKAGLLLVLVLCIIYSQAQQKDSTYYIQDTVWLKTGLTMPCKIIEDSTNSDYIFVSYMNSIREINKSRFAWTHVKTAHKHSQP